MKKLIDYGHFYEGVRWHDGHWWASDIYGPHVMKITPEGAATVVAKVEKRPSGLGWLTDGSLIVVSMMDSRLLRVGADGRTTVHADFAHLTPNFSNDMGADSRGNAYVSCFGFDLFGAGKPQPGQLVHVAPDGTTRLAADGLLFPNGVVFSPDERTLIVAESFGVRMTAFSIAADGSLHDRRVWAKLGEVPDWESMETLSKATCVPDGCSMGPDGTVWMADAVGGRVLKLVDGQIAGEVKGPPGEQVYSCAIGGPDWKDLLMCVAPEYHAEACIRDPRASLWVARVD